MHPGMSPPMMGMPPPMHLNPWEQQQWHMAQQQHAAHYHMAQQQMMAQQQADSKRKAEDDRRRKQDDERRKKQEEQRKKQDEEKAVRLIMQVCQKLRVATPESFDELKKDLDTTVAQEMKRAHNSMARMKEEVDKALAQATKCVEMINARRKLVEDKRREMEEKQKALEDRAKALLEELLGLVAAAEEQSRRLAEAAKPLGGLPPKVAPAVPNTVPPPTTFVGGSALVVVPSPMMLLAGATAASTAPAASDPASLTAEAPLEAGLVQEKQAEKEKEPESPPGDPEKLNDEELMAAAKAIEQVGEEAEAMTKSCTQFVLKKGPELKSLVPTAKQTDPADMNKALARLLSQIQELAVSSEVMLAKAKAAKAKVLKRTSAKERVRQGEDAFKKYDKDKDGFLSRSEVTAYARGEFSLKLPAKTVDKIWQNLVIEDTNGVAFKEFQHLKVMVGIAREVARDDHRKVVSQQKLKVIEQIRRGLSEKLKVLMGIAEEVNDTLIGMEKQVKTLLTRATSVSAERMVEMSDESDFAIQDTVDATESLRARMLSLSEGVEKRFQSDVQEFVKTQAKPLYTALGRTEGRLARARNLARRFREAAVRRRVSELERLRVAARRLIRHNRRKREVQDDGLFGSRVSEEEFRRFFAEADSEVRLADEREAALAEAKLAVAAAAEVAAPEPVGVENGEVGAALNGTAREEGATDEAEKWLADQLTAQAAAAPESPASPGVAGAGAVAGAVPKSSGPLVIAPPVGGIRAALNGANGLDNVELTVEAKLWLDVELAALKVGAQASQPERETETVKLSPEEVSRLYGALIGRDGEVLAGVDAAGDATMDGTLPRERLLACLGASSSSKQPV